MKMRSSRPPRRSNQSNRLTASDRLSDRDIDLRKVPVTRGQAGAVIYINHISIASLPARNGHCAARGDLHRSSVGSIDVLSFVIFKTTSSEWIPSAADSAFELTQNWPY